MYVIKARNVNQAYHQGMKLIQHAGQKKPSRVGSTLEVPFPVTTVYSHPTERVLFSDKRDANPFFHFMEGLWMLAGRDDLASMQYYNSSFSGYSDDGVTIRGAYGKRWRDHWSFDQLHGAIELLKKNKNDRRVVVTMWDPDYDAAAYLAGEELADIPCNTQAYFKVRNGALDMTVCCRSNDIIWGAYGANAVHMSMMFEYVSAMTNIPMGNYYQISDSYHAYTDILDKIDWKETDRVVDPYTRDSTVVPFPMVRNLVDWDSDLWYFLDNKEEKITDNPFFHKVAVRIRDAFYFHKHRDYEAAIDTANGISAMDWRFACLSWIWKRKVAWESK